MRILVLSIALFYFSASRAQEILTIENALNIALKNNFDIQVSRNEADIAQVNNTLGNAGMLPSVDISGTGSFELKDGHQEFSDDPEINYRAVTSVAINAGAELNWTLFDGGKMFVTRSKLNEIEALGEYQFKEQVLQTIYDVIAAYYEIVKQKQQLASINELLNFNQERVKIAQAGFKAGSLIKPDLIQAKIDYNVTMEAAIHQQYVIDAARKNLDVLLAREQETLFEVSDSIPLNYSPEKEKLIQKIDSVNYSILSFQKQVDISKLALKENQRLYSPTINFKAGYYFSQTDNSKGSPLLNQSVGPLIGGTINIPLYTSGETNRKVSIAKIQMQLAEINLQKIRMHKTTELKNALIDFENQQRLLIIEEENNELARENLDISLQRLRLGQTTSLEVHQAQEYFVQSFTRLTNFKYNLKLAEITIRQLVADL